MCVLPRCVGGVECDRPPQTESSLSPLSQERSRRRAAMHEFERSVAGKIHKSHHSLPHKHQDSTLGGSPGQIARKTHVTHDFILPLPNYLTNLSDATVSRRHWRPSPRKAAAMQHRTPSPNTKSRASVKFRAVVFVLSKRFVSFTRVFHFKQRRPKTHTPTHHRRIIKAISGLGIAAVRFML